MKVDFIFDVASPNAYLTHKVIPGIETRTGASFNYIPCLLGGIFKITNNQAPMIAFNGILNKLEYQNIEIQRFVKKHGLNKFTMNPHFPINTIQIQRGALAAISLDVFKLSLDVVFRSDLSTILPVVNSSKSSSAFKWSALINLAYALKKSLM